MPSWSKSSPLSAGELLGVQLQLSCSGVCLGQGIVRSCWSEEGVSAWGRCSRSLMPAHPPASLQSVRSPSPWEACSQRLPWVLVGSPPSKGSGHSWEAALPLGPQSQGLRVGASSSHPALHGGASGCCSPAEGWRGVGGEDGAGGGWGMGGGGGGIPAGFLMGEVRSAPGMLLLACLRGQAGKSIIPPQVGKSGES